MSDNPDWQFGSYDVLFDPMALDQLRHRVYRAHGQAIIALSVGIPVLFVVPLAAWGEGGLSGLGLALWLLAPFLVLLVAWLVVTVINRRRAAAWAHNRPTPGLVALRLSPSGVAVGATTYAWADIQRVYLRTPPRADQQLALAPRPGVRTDGAVVVGLEALVDPVGNIRSALIGLRGPSFVVSTLATPLSVLDAAFRHYSGGRIGIQYS